MPTNEEINAQHGWPGPPGYVEPVIKGIIEREMARQGYTREQLAALEQRKVPRVSAKKRGKPKSSTRRRMRTEAERERAANARILGGEEYARKRWGA